MSGLRIVMVGHCHPDMPHVCAMRMRCFAGAMAGRGLMHFRIPRPFL